MRSGRHTFEVDEFYGENEGLVVAEVELASEDEAFEKPDFIEMCIRDRFPFGYGLSYTTFSYDKVVLDKSEVTAGQTLKLTVPVTNVGKRDGEDVYKRQG